jgi:aspartate aminotransferase
MTHITSNRIQRLQATLQPVYDFFVSSCYARRAGDPAILDFAIGNPHELALPEFVAALQRWLPPQNKDWYGYPASLPQAQAAAAAGLNRRRGTAFQPDDIVLTNGAFAALSVSLIGLTDPGDEVIFNSPPWFFYETLVQAAEAVPVRVKVRPDNFDLDLQAIARAISPRTRAIIVNSPNNPTGRIYPPETLAELGRLLAEAGQRHGRPIYLLSDEAYSRILFDGSSYHSPTSYYPHSLLLYTYGKTLLAPGQRLGYVALPPDLPGRDQIRAALFVGQLMTGYAFPNALLQHALGDLEDVSIDIAHLQRKRDRLVAALREMGYELHVPQGTFYLLPRSPLADDLAFVDLLNQRDIYVLPGSLVELPGYFRISLTASDDMIDRALAGFASAREAALQARPTRHEPAQ